MFTCLMVTPLRLLKFRLSQLYPDTSRNEISTGSSVQFQCKRFPVDVDRQALEPQSCDTAQLWPFPLHRSIWRLELELSNALSFDTQLPSVQLICKSCTWHLWTCKKLRYDTDCHNGSIVAVQLALLSWEGAEVLAFGEMLSAQSPAPVSSEISDLLLFLSYFASQNKEIKSGNYFLDVCCVN